MSSPITAFEKSLRAFQTGGITYGDLLDDLQQLLSSGVSAVELQDILDKRQAIEPMSEQAYAEVTGILAEGVGAAPLETPATDTVNLSSNTAMAQPREMADSAPREAPVLVKALRNSGLTPMPGGRAWPASRVPGLSGTGPQLFSIPSVSDTDSASVARAAELATARAAELVTARGALEAAQNKTREITELARARIAEALNETEGLRIESRKLRESLTERDGQLSALQREHASIAPQTSTLAADLATARRALEEQQRASQEQLRAAEQQLRSADQQLRTAEHHQSDARQLREALAAQGAELVSLRQEHAKTARVIETRDERATELQADLMAVRARLNAVEAELSISQEAAARQASDLKRREADLGAVRRELGSAQTQSNSYLESLRSREWRQGYDHSRALEPTAMPMAVTTSQAQPMLRAAAPTVALRVPSSEGKRRAVALGATLVVLLVLISWVISRHKPATHAEAPSSAIAFSPGSVIQDCSTCPTVTVLPSGRFKQGSLPVDAGYSVFEGPQHWVMMARPFAMSTNPITVDQFAHFVEATGRDMQGCDMYDGTWKNRPDSSWRNPGFVQAGNHPVTCVSFDDATAYAEWLSAQTHHTYRLPSASEWEYAARAGSTAAQPWATVADACADANVADASAAHRYPGWTVFACDDGFVNTSPVGSFKANAFGLNDMLGNVFQWTRDCWNKDYTGAPIDGSARASGDCGSHELRGGSWFSAPKYVRTAYRNQFAADYRTSSAGIRLVREL